MTELPEIEGKRIKILAEEGAGVWMRATTPSSGTLTAGPP